MNDMKVKNIICLVLIIIFMLVGMGIPTTNVYAKLTTQEKQLLDNYLKEANKLTDDLNEIKTYPLAAVVQKDKINKLKKRISELLKNVEKIEKQAKKANVFRVTLKKADASLPKTVTIGTEVNFQYKIQMEASGDGEQIVTWRRFYSKDNKNYVTDDSDKDKFTEDKFTETGKAKTQTHAYTPIKSGYIYYTFKVESTGQIISTKGTPIHVVTEGEESEGITIKSSKVTINGKSGATAHPGDKININVNAYCSDLLGKDTLEAVAYIDSVRAAKDIYGDKSIKVTKGNNSKSFGWTVKQVDGKSNYDLCIIVYPNNSLSGSQVEGSSAEKGRIEINIKVTPKSDKATTTTKVGKIKNAKFKATSYTVGQGITGMCTVYDATVQKGVKLEILSEKGEVVATATIDGPCKKGEVSSTFNPTKVGETWGSKMGIRATNLDTNGKTDIKYVKIKKTVTNSTNTGAQGGTTSTPGASSNTNSSSGNTANNQTNTNNQTTTTNTNTNNQTTSDNTTTAKTPEITNISIGAPKEITGGGYQYTIKDGNISGKNLDDVTIRYRVAYSTNANQPSISDDNAWTTEDYTSNFTLKDLKTQSREAEFAPKNDWKFVTIRFSPEGGKTAYADIYKLNDGKVTEISQQGTKTTSGRAVIDSVTGIPEIVSLGGTFKLTVKGSNIKTVNYVLAYSKTGRTIIDTWGEGYGPQVAEEFTRDNTTQSSVNSDGTSATITVKVPEGWKDAKTMTIKLAPRSGEGKNENEYSWWFTKSMQIGTNGGVITMAEYLKIDEAKAIANFKAAYPEYTSARSESVYIEEAIINEMIKTNNSLLSSYKQYWQEKKDSDARIAKYFEDTQTNWPATTTITADGAMTTSYEWKLAEDLLAQICVNYPNVLYPGYSPRGKGGVYTSTDVDKIKLVKTDGGVALSYNESSNPHITAYTHEWRLTDTNDPVLGNVYSIQLIGGATSYQDRGMSSPPKTYKEGLNEEKINKSINRDISINVNETTNKYTISGGLTQVGPITFPEVTVSK